MKKIVIIEADTNDADYITSNMYITDRPDLEDLIRKVAKCIKSKGKRHNWLTTDYAGQNDSPEEIYKDILTQEEIEIFNDMVPHGEYGIHTIESIRLLNIESEERIL